MVKRSGKRMREVLQKKRNHPARLQSDGMPRPCRAYGSGRMGPGLYVWMKGTRGGLFWYPTRNNRDYTAPFLSFPYLFEYAPCAGPCNVPRVWLPAYGGARVQGVHACTYYQSTGDFLVAQAQTYYYGAHCGSTSPIVGEAARIGGNRRWWWGEG